MKTTSALLGEGGGEKGASQKSSRFWGFPDNIEMQGTDKDLAASQERLGPNQPTPAAHAPTLHDWARQGDCTERSTNKES